MTRVLLTGWYFRLRKMDMFPNKVLKVAAVSLLAMS